MANSSYSIQAVVNASLLGFSHFPYLEKAEQVMAEYIQPVICIFGILCNILNLLVLTRPQLKESPYTYLLGLAVADLSALVMLFIRIGIYPRFGKGIYGWQVFNAFIFLPFANTFSNSSIWITVFLTIERWISVKFPLQAKKICTKQLARQIMCGIVTIVFINNIPRFFCRDIIRKPTNDSFEYVAVSSKFEQSDGYEAIVWTQIICILFIPCLILTILNTCLLHVVYKANRSRAELNGRNENNIAVHVSREQLRLTVTCASIICLFLVCVVPTAFSMPPVAYALFGHGKEKEEFINDALYRLMSMVCNTMITVNLSSNFILYCFFNHKFFKTLQHLVKAYRYRICKMSIPDNTLRRTSTCTSSFSLGKRVSFSDKSSNLNRVNQFKRSRTDTCLLSLPFQTRPEESTSTSRLSETSLLYC